MMVFWGWLGAAALCALAVALCLLTVYEKARQRRLEEAQAHRIALAKIAHRVKTSQDVPPDVRRIIDGLAGDAFNDRELLRILMFAWRLPKTDDPERRRNRANKEIKNRYGDKWGGVVIEALNLFARIVIFADPGLQRRDELYVLNRQIRPALAKRGQAKRLRSRVRTVVEKEDLDGLCVV